jgi:hypothetical protein
MVTRRGARTAGGRRGTGGAARARLPPLVGLVVASSKGDCHVAVAKRHRRTAAQRSAAVDGDRPSPRWLSAGRVVDGARAVLPRTPASVSCRCSCSARHEPIGISQPVVPSDECTPSLASCYAVQQYDHCTRDIERVNQQVTGLLKDSRSSVKTELWAETTTVLQYRNKAVYLYYKRSCQLLKTLTVPKKKL